MFGAVCGSKMRLVIRNTLQMTTNKTLRTLPKNAEDHLMGKH